MKAITHAVPKYKFYFHNFDSNSLNRNGIPTLLAVTIKLILNSKLTRQIDLTINCEQLTLSLKDFLIYTKIERAEAR